MFIPNFSTMAEVFVSNAGLATAVDCAQLYTAASTSRNWSRHAPYLDQTHAFADPNGADAACIRLPLPE